MLGNALKLNIMLNFACLILKHKVISMKYMSLFLFAILIACSHNQNNAQAKGEEMEYKINKTESEWKEELTAEEYRILREKGTEMPYSGEYNSHYEPGIYVCAGCGAELFTSNTKFDSHCGWPSFYEKIEKKAILEKPDYSHGMVRTEVLCANCGGHLGHVFEDGPNPTGLRYCINSVSLNFLPKEEYDNKDNKKQEESE